MFKLQGDFAPRSRLAACCWDPVLSRTVWLTPPLTLVPVRSQHRLALSSTLLISLISPLTLVWPPAVGPLRCLALSGSVARILLNPCTVSRPPAPSLSHDILPLAPACYAPHTHPRTSGGLSPRYKYTCVSYSKKGDFMFRVFCADNRWISWSQGWTRRLDMTSTLLLP